MLLFFAVYNIVLILAAILLLPVILIAFVVKPKFRAGFFEKNLSKKQKRLSSFKLNPLSAPLFTSVNAVLTIELFNTSAGSGSLLLTSVE